MTRKTLVLGLALAAVATTGAVPALGADSIAASTSSTTTGPVSEPEQTEEPEDEEPEDEDSEDKDPEDSPAPVADETGCRNVVDGDATWIRPVTLPRGLGEVSLGSGIIDSESVLAAPSCKGVSYSLVLFDASASTHGAEVRRFTAAGTGESSTVQVREIFSDYDQPCVYVQLQVSEVVGGQAVLHDAAPNSPVEVCDNLEPGSGGRAWN